MEKNNSIIHQYCNIFANQIKELIESELKKQCNLYLTNDMKQLVTREFESEYIGILEKINSIENNVKVLIED